MWRCNLIKVNDRVFFFLVSWYKNWKSCLCHLLPGVPGHREKQISKHYQILCKSVVALISISTDIVVYWISIWIVEVFDFSLNWRCYDPNPLVTLSLDVPRVRSCECGCIHEVSSFLSSHLWSRYCWLNILIYIPLPVIVTAHVKKAKEIVPVGTIQRL